MTCQMCNGPQKLLGNLGDRVHLRCIDCGIDSSIDKSKIGEHEGGFWKNGSDEFD